MVLFIKYVIRILKVSKRSKKSATKISPQTSIKELPIINTTSKKNLPLPSKGERIPSLTIEEMEY